MRKHLQPLEGLLEKHFHFTDFREGQREVIEDILLNKDVFAMLPTGIGKSLCYLLPGYVLNGMVVIVSPLLSLMEDQVQQIRRQGEKRVAALNSFLSFQERKFILNNLREYKYLFVSPETLQSQFVRDHLVCCHVSLFVVDEAHCISQWGHEFRPDYLELAGIREKLGSPPCLALTATATKRVQQDIIKQLRLNAPTCHVYSVDRPNISLLVHKCESTQKKLDQVLNLVQTLEGPGIIYFSTREWSEKVAELVAEKTMLRTAYYHGGLLTEDRLLIQQQFLNDQMDVICSTNAFGMGINKPNVRYVIHFHYPNQMNAYIQEIGRAGRDGEPSIAITLYSNEDHAMPEAMIDKTFPDSKEIETVFSILSQSEIRPYFTETCIELGIDETHIRLYHYYLKEILNSRVITESQLERAKLNLTRFIEDRLELKREELFIMKQWLEEDKCRREGYLKVFDEEKKGSVDSCCDLCGLELTDFKTNQPKVSSPRKYLNWKQELQRLLHQDVLV